MTIDEKTLAILADVSLRRDFIKEEIDAGIDIEFNTGRLKAYDYVFTRAGAVFKGSDNISDAIDEHLAYLAVRKIAPSVSENGKYTIVCKNNRIIDITGENPDEKRKA